jgi:hypothetical protein
MERNPLAPAAHHNIVDLTGESETSGKMPSKSWMPSDISEGKQGYVYVKLELRLMSELGKGT